MKLKKKTKLNIVFVIFASIAFMCAGVYIITSYTKLMKKLKTEYVSVSPQDKNPFIFTVTYYALNSEIQKKQYDNMFQNNRAVFFSTHIKNNMTNLFWMYFEKAYQENIITFFYIYRSLHD